MTVSSTTSSTDIYSQLGIGQQSTKRETSGNDLDMDSFLTLMTAQMKNQDPTKPMDSAQYLGQLAQFSSVKGLQQLDTRLQGMTLMMGQQQALQASDLVGKDAMIKTNTAETANDGDPVDGIVTMTGAGTTNVQVLDSGKNVIATIPVKADAAGDVEFKWDGNDTNGVPAKAGTYTFSAKSGDKALDTQISARINSVAYTANGIVMNLQGHDNVTFDQILSIEDTRSE